MKFLPNIILASCTLLMMSGCTGYGVTFQTAPGTELANCNPSLVGDWRVIEGERNAPTSGTEDFLSVSNDCATMYSITTKRESGKKTDKVDDLKNRQDYQIQFSSDAEYDYVIVTPKETSFEVTPKITLPSGKMIYQINKGKDGIILRSIDLDKTIQLVLDRKISGQVFVDRDNPGSSSTTSVYVRGDAKQIANYLNTLDMYSDNRLLLVSATSAEVKQLAKAIKKHEKGKKEK